MNIRKDASDGEDHGLSRRSALKVIVVSAGAFAGVLEATQPAQADPGSTGLAGRIRTVGSETLVLETSSGVVKVAPTPGARMYSGAYGEVASTEGFYRDDVVFAQGHRMTTGFTASAIGSIFEPWKATVTKVSKDGSEAETTRGPLLLTSGRLPFTPLSLSRRLKGGRVKRGMVIHGEVWRNPSTGQRFLMVRG